MPMQGRGASDPRGQRRLRMEACGRMKVRLALVLALVASPAFADPSIQVAFSPNAGATEAVVAVIQSAQKTVHLAAYSFTSKPIAQALLAAKARGVDVEAVLDKSNATAGYTAATFLANAQ